MDPKENVSITICVETRRRLEHFIRKKFWSEENLFNNMNFNDITFEKIGEWFTCKQQQVQWKYPLWAIFAVMILIGVLIYFLWIWWTTSEFFPEAPQRTTTELGNGRRRFGQCCHARNRENSSYAALVNTGNARAMPPVKITRLEIAPCVTGWKDYVPYKYLSNPKNIYTARKPI